MIRKLELYFGPSGPCATYLLDLGSITIFVGPNNSGKSLILREIENICTHGKSVEGKIVKDIDFNFPSKEEIKDFLETHKIPFLPQDTPTPNSTKICKFHSIQGSVQKVLNIESLMSWMKDSLNTFISHYISMFVARFGGKARFQLVKEQPLSDLKQDPRSCLMRLFQDDAKRSEVRALIYEAFKKFFVLDATGMSNLVIRLSDESPPSNDVERGWGENSVNFHKRAKHIQDFSDGVQAFTGLALTVMSGDEKIMLIDEPEAFLHPALANLLGRKLAEIMSQRDGNLVVSTHSPFFVMGCLQSGKPLNIIRLTYDDSSGPTARVLPAEKVSELFKNPLLRSTGVIQALFFSNVIVTEADADRALYNEINERMLTSNLESGIANSLFLNAQSKQTVCDIIKPLRQMGIPAVGIVDIDFVKDGGSEFTKALSSIGVPSELHESLAAMRHKVKTALEATGKNMKRDGGINLLSGGNLALANKFLSDLREYGLFVVPGGELESWLKHFNCTGHASTWLIQVFNKLGTDPQDPSYQQPTAGDVWEFMGLIKAWTQNPQRKGIL